ncbi:hypothetical protein SEUCBS139899_002186 [Sporothrix eucalyptigena]|uniref:SnoaL-like domain-containing protein n=1 Tax=Sporothrix eucalyptigena TaxID=1812306 RepID=A0ABP0B4X5_9PEZI
MTSPQDPHTEVFSHINGPLEDVVDRVMVSEICKGWPVYRDNSEWKNFRSLFAPKATVWTTWSGACDVDKFIDISKAGKQKGVFILHRECGTLVELGAVPDADLDVEGDVEPASATTPDAPLGRPITAGMYRSVRRAVGKMKATITQRFVNLEDGNSFDVDCDCRFIFFLEKVVETDPKNAPGGVAQPRWRTVYVKLFYEKDKVVPADGHSAPRFTTEERQYMRDSLPEGYRYLGTMQRRLGYTIDEKLPTPRNAGWERMYSAMEAWLAGRKATLG